MAIGTYLVLIAFRIKLDAKFPTKSLVRAIFFLGFTFNNAPKKHFARDLGISTSNHATLAQTYVQSLENLGIRRGSF